MRRVGARITAQMRAIAFFLACSKLWEHGGGKGSYHCEEEAEGKGSMYRGSVEIGG